MSQLTGTDPNKTAGGFTATSVADPNATQQTAGVSTQGAGGLNSTQEGLASKKGQTGTAIRIEDAAAEKKVSDKRKADTDCANREFELTL